MNTRTSQTRSLVRRSALTKAAGLASDYLATLPSQIAAHSGIPIISVPTALANMGGAIGGLAVAPESSKNPKTDALSLVPGVGSFRLSQRQRRVMDESNRRGAKGTANLVAEYLGPVTSSLVGGGAGALIGGVLGAGSRDRLGRSRAGVGAAIGGISGAVLPPIIGAIVAGIRRKRSLEEQVQSDSGGRAVAKYLVPGLATHDSLKRLGASTHLDDSGDKKQKKAAEAQDAYVAGFCKAAEAMGVDPVALYKQAAPWGAIGKLIAGTGRLVTRGVGAARGAGRAIGNSRVGVGARSMFNRARAGMHNYFNTLRGTQVQHYQDIENRMHGLADRAFRAGATPENMSLYARANRAWGNATAARMRAQDATDFARGATALGLGTAAAGGLAYKHFSGNEPEAPAQDYAPQDYYG